MGVSYSAHTFIKIVGEARRKCVVINFSDVDRYWLLNIFFIHFDAIFYIIVEPVRLK